MNSVTICLFLYCCVPYTAKIINQEFPSCKNCIHFKPSILIGNQVDTFSRCSKFGEKNLLTNSITYDYADSSRRSDIKCGAEGKFFRYDKYSELKFIILCVITPTNIVLMLMFLTFLSTLAK